MKIWYVRVIYLTSDTKLRPIIQAEVSDFIRELDDMSQGSVSNGFYLNGFILFR